ncbi:MULTISPECIES: hypothetical protein [unclassified Streptomyces]|nr:hypothetical protein [Streptomyces sp. TSRI0281]
MAGWASAPAAACEGYDGVDCGAKLASWTYRDQNLTPINSIKLSE